MSGQAQSPPPRGPLGTGKQWSGLAVELPPELLEQIAERAAGIAAEHLQPADGTGRWLRGAKAIAEYIDAPVSRVNALSSAKRIPIERDGSNLLAHTDELDSWIRNGGGKRP